jgi:hypothetical protein
VSCPVGQNHVALALASLTNRPRGRGRVQGPRRRPAPAVRPAGGDRATKASIRSRAASAMVAEIAGAMRRPWPARRHPTKPRPAKPSGIIARIGGAGAAPSIAKCIRRSIRGGPHRKRKKYGASPFRALVPRLGGCLVGFTGFTVTLAFFHNYGPSPKNVANKGPCRTIREICKRHRNSQSGLGIGFGVAP